MGSLYDNVKWIHLTIHVFHAQTFDRLRISYGSSCRQEFEMIVNNQYDKFEEQSRIQTATLKIKKNR